MEWIVGRTIRDLHPRYRDRLGRMRRDVDAQRARAGERGLLDVAQFESAR